MPSALASNFFRISVRSSFFTGNTKPICAQPPDETIPERQRVPALGWLSVAVLFPAGVVAANRGQLLPHESEIATALLTKGKPLGTQRPEAQGSVLPPAPPAAVPPEPPTAVAPMPGEPPAPAVLLLSDAQAACSAMATTSERIARLLIVLLVIGSPYVSSCS